MTDKAKPYLRKVTYDKEANAIYVKVRDTKVAKTIPHDGCIETIINYDVDKDENLVGVEILL